MKKTYINPEIEVLKIQTMQMLAASDLLDISEETITDEADLAGLPETARESAAATAKERGLEGWVFTLHAPSYGPFMTYADNRELRRQMYIAKNTICTHGDDRDNRELVRRIVNLRLERAQLMGYKCFADFVLERRMARKVPSSSRTS